MVQQAMTNHTMAMPSDKMGIVHMGKCKDRPDGQAWKITAQLEEQFAPRDLASKIKLRVALS
jgi:hypothetical protein